MRLLSASSIGMQIVAARAGFCITALVRECGMLSVHAQACRSTLRNAVYYHLLHSMRAPS